MIEAAIKAFDALQIRSDAERRWHRSGLWLAVLMLMPAGYLLMLGLAAKAPFLGLWASMPFIGLAAGVYAACRAAARVMR